MQTNPNRRDPSRGFEKRIAPYVSEEAADRAIRRGDRWARAAEQRGDIDARAPSHIMVNASPTGQRIAGFQHRPSRAAEINRSRHHQAYSADHVYTHERPD